MDIDKLKALALAATPGPWKMATDWDRAAVYSETHMVPRYKDSPINKRVVCSGNQNNLSRYGQEHWSGADWHDAEFIAAANPATVLELIAEVERLRARFEYIEDHATTHGGGNGFTVSFFVPVDCEDIGCGIDAEIESHNKAGKEPA